MKLLKEPADLGAIEIAVAFGYSSLCQCEMYFIPFLRTVFVTLQKRSVSINFIYIIDTIRFYYL